jgi:fucose permease
MKPTSPKIILALSYLTYLLLGVFLAGIGPVLAELSAQTASSLAAIGGVLTFVFLGSVIALIVAGPLTDRLGHKPVLVTSLVVLFAGIVGITTAQALPVMFLLALIAGLGQGGVDVGTNLVVADAAPGNSTSALNVLHFFFGAGAFVGPAFIGLAIALSGSGLPVHWGAAGLFLVLALANAAFLQGGLPQQPRAGSSPDASTGFEVYLSPLLWLMGALMLVYVGVEFGLGSWISTYMNISTGMTAQYGAWVTSVYWAALALGRLAGALASRKLTRFRLLAAALGGSFLGGIGLFASHGVVYPTVLCLAWIAFAYGTVYPTTVALAASAFASGRGKAVSVLVAMGSIGAATLPLLAGSLLENDTSLGYLWFVALSLAILLLLLWAIGRAFLRHVNPAL